MRFAAGAKITAEAELDSGEQAIPDVSFQIQGAGRDRRRVRGEQSDGAGGFKLNASDNRNAEHNGDRRGVKQDLNRALVLFSADVLRPQRRYG